LNGLKINDLDMLRYGAVLMTTNDNEAK